MPCNAMPKADREIALHIVVGLTAADVGDGAWNQIRQVRCRRAIELRR